MTLEDFEAPARRNALAFTVLVHTGLIAALILGVQWKRSPSDVVEVELWASRPTPAVQAALASAVAAKSQPRTQRHPAGAAGTTSNQSRRNIPPPRGTGRCCNCPAVA